MPFTPIEYAKTGETNRFAYSPADAVELEFAGWTAVGEGDPFDPNTLSPAVLAAVAAAVQARVAELVGTSPELLNTLEELGEAIDNDPDFAGTVMAEIGTKATQAALTAESSARVSADSAEAAARAAADNALTAAVAAKLSRGADIRTANATLTEDSNPIQLVDASAGNISITLPSTTIPGHMFTIKKIDSSAFTVFPAVGHTIDGIGGFSFANQNQFVTVVSTTVAGAWRLVGSNFWFGQTAFNGLATFSDGVNLVVGTGTGTKIGTATGQKLGFFNATPVVQQGATVDLGTVLSNLGLRAVGTAYPLTTTGAIAANGPFRSAATARTGAVTFTVGSTVWLNTADATTAPFTITLAATTTAGHRFVIMKTDATANAVTIAGTINGAANYILTARYQWVEVMSTAVSGEWLVLNQGGPAQHAAKTTTATLNANEKGTTLADAAAGAFTITPPATTVQGIEFTIKKTDNTDNIVTIAGTFLNPSGNITNLKLYVPNQYHRFVTTGVSGTFQPLESSPVHAPSGTPVAGLPDGTIFMEY